jgi:hypothetical protein
MIDCRVLLKESPMVGNKHEFEARIATVARETKLTKEQVRAVVRGMHPSTTAYVLDTLATVPLGKLGPLKQIPLPV